MGWWGVPLIDWIFFSLSFFLSFVRLDAVLVAWVLDSTVLWDSGMTRGGCSSSRLRFFLVNTRMRFFVSNANS